jgi:hypothetical protein
MAHHHNDPTSMLAQGLGQRSGYAMMKICDRFTTGEDDAVRVAAPIGRAVGVDELLVRQSVALRPWVVFTEGGIDFDVEPNTRLDDLRSLTCSWIRAGNQRCRRQLAGRRKSIQKPLGLLTAEIGQAIARARPADHAPNGHIGLSVANQHEPSRSEIISHIEEDLGT